MRKLLNGGLSFAALLLLSACGEEPTGMDSTPVTGSAPLVQDLTGPRIHRPHEAHADSLSRVIPGFGGYGYTRDGNMVILLMDTSFADQARNALRPALLGRIRSGHRPASARGEMLVRPAAFEFRQLAGWRDRLSDDVLDLPGVLFTDLTEDENRITVAVTGPSAREVVARRLPELRIPGAAVQFITGDSIGHDAGPASSSVMVDEHGEFLTSRFRPLKGGIKQLSYGDDGLLHACTIGYIFHLDGVPGYITNSHCTLTKWGPDSTQNFFQPDFLDPDFVGVEGWDDPGQSCGSLSPNTCRWSDMAWVRLNAGVQGKSGYLAHPQYFEPADALQEPERFRVRPAIDDFRIIDEAVPVRWDYVDKIGIGSGWYAGDVRYTCIDTRADANRRRIRCQDLADYESREGDSGGPVFIYRSFTEVTQVGIHWGKYYHDGAEWTIFSSLSNVRDDFLGYTATLR